VRWQDGYPCDSGSTDGQDSARLAGLMVLFDHNDASSVFISDYTPIWHYYVRHPIEGNKYAFSRDQAVCLFAGFAKRYYFYRVNPDFNPPNGDWISPSVRGHFKRCAYKPDTWLERQWLWLDVIWSSFINPMAEPNQLICMLMIADPKYLRAWVKWNKKWKLAINAYWCDWRDEKELAALMIKTIESKENE